MVEVTKSGQTIQVGETISLINSPRENFILYWLSSSSDGRALADVAMEAGVPHTVLCSWLEQVTDADNTSMATKLLQQDYDVVTDAFLDWAPTLGGVCDIIKFNQS